MEAWKRLLSLLVVFAVILGARPHRQKNKLLVILFDGFRWDYFDKGTHPGFERMFKNGVRADYMEPVFPTVSYTNYYSIMTGLYAETHGMIGNFMYDPKHKEYFLIGSNYEQFHGHWWNGGDPVWITARRQGVRSHMFYWPGCEVQIRDLNPNQCLPYFGPPTMDELRSSIETSLELFKANNSDFAAIYVELPDKRGHWFGPDSKEILDVTQDLDIEMTYLQDQLAAQDLTDKVNVILVSDHGMTSVSPRKLIDLSQWVSKYDFNFTFGGGAMASIWPKEEDDLEIYNRLKGKHPNLHVYLKHEIPERWHYKNHYRVAPMILTTDSPWYMLLPGRTFPFHRDLETNRTVDQIGTHGFPPESEDMRGIFAATGPDFQNNKRQPGIKAVDVYQVMCLILGISPSPHNGTWDHVRNMMARTGNRAFWRNDAGKATSTTFHYYTIIVSFIVTFTLNISHLDVCLLQVHYT